MTRRSYAGGAVSTTITGDLASSGALTIGIASTTGWPDGSGGKFAIVVDPGTASEEKMLVTSRTATNLTVASADRGYDGTSAVAHSSSAVIRLSVTATDFDEANSHVNDAASHLGTATVTAGMLHSGAIDSSAAFAAGVVDTAALADNSVTSAKIVDATIATGDIADSAITTAKLNDASVTSAKIVDGTIATGDIADSAVTDAKRGALLYGRWRRTVGLTFTTGTLQTFTMDTEDHDDNGGWWDSNATFTCPTGADGWYEVMVYVKITTVTTKVAAAIETHEGGVSYIYRGTESGSTTSEYSVSRLLKLAAGDYVQAGCANNSGGSITTSLVRLDIVKVGK